MIPRLISRLRDEERARLTEDHRDGGDERGIALQTIIIIVVLLAIAGAVAAVLLTRAGTETDRLKEETDRWSDIANETGCKIANGVWSTPGDPTGSCGPPAGGGQTPVAVASDFDGDQAGCRANSHTWNDADTDNDGDDSTMPNDGTCT